MVKNISVKNVLTLYIYIYPFSTKEALVNHIEKCKRNEPQRVNLPEKGKHITKFTHIERMLKKPYIFYADLEALMRFSENITNFTTEKTAEQVACSYGYSFIRSDGLLKNIEIKHCDNPIEEFIHSLIDQLDYIRDKLDKPVPLQKMSNQEWHNYHSSKNCWICKKPCREARFNKIHVIDPITEYYIGAVHRYCHGNNPIIKATLSSAAKELHKATKQCIHCKKTSQ